MDLFSEITFNVYVNQFKVNTEMEIDDTPNYDHESPNHEISQINKSDCINSVIQTNLDESDTFILSEFIKYSESLNNDRMSKPLTLFDLLVEKQIENKKKHQRYDEDLVSNKKYCKYSF